ncbi:hypothetical protein ASPWEDRAFT_172586 [Aspergillus wentii DTO 134E9]|uniref:DUF7730 domain-containing protein n=1 Tax=Aspergillus wentii DTO 134E9 TaxID=1073089 RepID=A0A1L9RLU5_ASPWE|nr:uncharacterized protein ASPWEDRAFT_172586 [Aspergillus wentii DTO 134E9]KAI9929752.1 hypothetical protein MW887_001228 [Aspergillus wentii]OJJ35788.1 hypothetical protein ASPWEDRAFT_172586 [Aspergillus wentii DTO 134E9]
MSRKRAIDNPNALTTVSKRTRRGVQKAHDEHGLYKITNPSTPFPLFNLPPEIRTLIYKYAIGNRVIHIHPWAQYLYDAPHVGYFYCVCKSGPTLDKTGSEYRIAQSWEEEGKPTDIPECGYEAIRHLNGFPNRMDEAREGTERLFLDLLRVSKRVYEEAGAIAYSSNIYAFEEVNGFRSFLMQGLGLGSVRAGLLRKVVLTVAPKSREMHWWNGYLGSKTEGGIDILDSLRGVEEVHFVLKRAYSLPSPVLKGEWDELCFVYGVLQFGKLGLKEVSIGHDEWFYKWIGKDEERLGRYKKVMRGKLLSWNEKESDMERERQQLEKEYTERSKFCYF